MFVREELTTKYELASILCALDRLALRRDQMHKHNAQAVGISTNALHR